MIHVTFSTCELFALVQLIILTSLTKLYPYILQTVVQQNIKWIYLVYVRTYYHPYVGHCKKKERYLKQLYFAIHIEYSAIHCLPLRDPETFIDTWLFIAVPKCSLEESCLCTTPLSFKAGTEFTQLHGIFVTTPPAVPMCLIHEHADRSFRVARDTMLPWNARNFHITKRSSKTSLMLLTLLL